jgi:quercetin dioxygenase-like cupin family protein
MKRVFFLFALFFQSLLFAQDHLNLDTIHLFGNESIKVQKIAGDSLTSSFIIEIKDKVKKHYHREHSETIYVIDGKGEMILGDKTIQVKPGDYLFIPKGTVHAVKVTSKNPLKVLSIQAPLFDGKDRILLD